MKILSHQELISELQKMDSQILSDHAKPTVFEQAATMLKQWAEKWAAVAKTPTALAIDILRGNEGSCVTINSSNAEGCGPDNECIEVVDDWTDWKPRRFQGHTLTEAFEKALDAMPDRCKRQEPRP